MLGLETCFVQSLWYLWMKLLYFSNMPNWNNKIHAPGNISDNLPKKTSPNRFFYKILDMASLFRKCLLIQGPLTEMILDTKVNGRYSFHLTKWTFRKHHLEYSNRYGSTFVGKIFQRIGPVISRVKYVLVNKDWIICERVKFRLVSCHERKCFGSSLNGV
jgi:hypothetical protein